MDLFLQATFLVPASAVRFGRAMVVLWNSEYNCIKTFNGKVGLVRLQFGVPISRARAYVKHIAISTLNVK